MLDFAFVRRTCMTNLAGGTSDGTLELYDRDERRRLALQSLKRNMKHFISLGDKYKKYRVRVEKNVLTIQENIRFVMEKPDTREEWRVNNVDELLKAFDEGYELSSEETYIPSMPNPCAEIPLGTPEQTNLMTFAEAYSMSGSPFHKQLTPAQLRLIARAIWRRMFPASRDSVIVEALPHIKLSKTVAQKLKGLLKTTTAIELLYAFYNQSRQPRWWRELRQYRGALRDAVNRQLYAIMVAEYLWDGIHPQVLFRNEWKTTTVMSLLRNMRESEEFSVMPILADALQDAGCSEESLLAHYRNPDAKFSLGSWIFRATGLI